MFNTFVYKEFKAAMLFGRMAIQAIAKMSQRKDQQLCFENPIPNLQPEWEYYKHFAYLHEPFNVVIPTGVASYWSEDLSKPYRTYRFEHEKELLI